MNPNNNNKVTLDVEMLRELVKNSTSNPPPVKFKPNRVMTVSSSGGKPKSQVKSIGKNKNKKNNRSQQGVNLDEDAIVYRGPIHLPESAEEAQIQIFNVSYTSEQALTAGAGDFVFATGLVRSISDWANIEATWHEYRVLGMEWTFVPYYNCQLTTSVNTANLSWSVMPVVSCVDRAAGAQLGSYASGAQHESAKFFMSNKEHRRTIRMDGSEEAVWTVTNTTFSWGWIKMFCNNTTLSSWGGYASAVQPIGRSFFTFLVEVRGRS